MNSQGLKVVFRAKDGFISARLELECQRAFAVINGYDPKATKDVVSNERMELEVQFLQQMNESEYLYKKLVELPKPRQSGPGMFNPDLSGKEPANRHSLRGENTSRISDVNQMALSGSKF